MPRPFNKFPIAAVPFPSPVPVLELGVVVLVAEAFGVVVLVEDFDGVVAVFVIFSAFGAEILAFLPVIIFSSTIISFAFGCSSGLLSSTASAARLPSWFAGSYVCFPFWLSPKLISMVVICSGFSMVLVKV